MRLPFGQWTPDVPDAANESGLAVAKNVVPIAGGYGPQASWVSLGISAMPDRPTGATAAVANDGTGTNFGGTATGLYQLGGAPPGLTDVTRSSGPYNGTEKTRWEFAAVGRFVIATNFNDDIQVFDLVAGGLFSRLSPNAPRARHVGIIKNHVVFGGVFDAYFGDVPNSIWWPAIGDPFTWPTPGSADAIQLQSDRQELQGDGGWVQRVISGSEVGCVMQERAIWRADYVGGDVIFDLTRVEPNRGLLIPGAVASKGRWIFYLSEDGFQLFDYTQSQQIGKGRINRYFFNDLDEDYTDRVSTVVDPDETRVYVSYPGAGNVGGMPNKYLCWDWELNRWAHGDLDTELLMVAVTPGLDLDAPDTPADPDEVDATPELPPFDERLTPPGSETLACFDDSYVLGTLTGASLEARLETGLIELNQGRRSLVNNVRLVVSTSGAEPRVEVAGIARSQDAIIFDPPQPIDEDGDSPQRSDGRYHRFAVTLPSGFTEAVGMEIDAQRMGVR